MNSSKSRTRVPYLPSASIVQFNTLWESALLFAFDIVSAFSPKAEPAHKQTQRTINKCQDKQHKVTGVRIPIHVGAFFVGFCLLLGKAFLEIVVCNKQTQRMEVNRRNFAELLPEIKDSVERCDFMAFDTEFTGSSFLFSSLNSRGKLS